MRNFKLAACLVASVILGFYAARTHSKASIISSYVTTSEQLVVALQNTSGPIAVQVGSGFKAAPIKLEYRCMSLDIRAGWYDKHVDNGNCVVVIVISDTSRATK